MVQSFIASLFVMAGILIESLSVLRRISNTGHFKKQVFVFLCVFMDKETSETEE